MLPTTDCIIKPALKRPNPNLGPALQYFIRMRASRLCETCPKPLHLKSNHQPRWLALGLGCRSARAVYRLLFFFFFSSSLFIFHLRSPFPFFFIFPPSPSFPPLRRFPSLLFKTLLRRAPKRSVGSSLEREDAPLWHAPLPQGQIMKGLAVYSHTQGWCHR